LQSDQKPESGVKLKLVKFAKRALLQTLVERMPEKIEN
jgi:hypothetical protein